MEKEKIDLKTLKKNKLEQLKINCQKYIFSKYSENEQRNLGINGTPEERQGYSDFLDAVKKLIYQRLKEQIIDGKNAEEVEKVDIDFKAYEKALTYKDLHEIILGEKTFDDFL